MAKDAKNNSKEVKNKKHFFKDFKAELKKVIWPTTKQITNKTVAVITMVLIIAIIVFVLDFVFNIFNEYGINKLKSDIKNKMVIENTIDNSVNGNEVAEGNTVQNESSAENVQ